MTELRVGVVGTGRFGRLHIEVLNQHQSVEIIAISDVNPAALNEANKQLNLPSNQLFTDPLTLINSEEIDLVDIVSDEYSHYNYVIAALRACKHVIVEKPLAVTKEQAYEIADMMAISKKQVYVGQILRFSQSHFSIKHRIEKGYFGKLALMQAKRNFSQAWFASFGSRIHPLLESGVHDIDLLVWYANSACKKVIAFEANTSSFEQPNIMTAMLEFENGVVASLSSSWLVPSGSPQNLIEGLELDGTIDASLEIIGSHATAKYDLANSNIYYWDESGVKIPESSLWPVGPTGIAGAIKEELFHFVACAIEHIPSPFMPLSDAVHVLEIIDAMKKSIRTDSIVYL